MKNNIFSTIALAIIVFVSGCGYTIQTVSPYPDAKSITVPMFRNKIAPESILTYVAGLEADITQGVIDELVRDGTLKVVDPEEADLELTGKIVGYEQEGFRFNRFEQVQEFRLFIVVSLTLTNKKTGEVIWEEENFSGDTQYFIDGPREVTEEVAAAKAITDLTEKIVNRVVEHW